MTGAAFSWKPGRRADFATLASMLTSYRTISVTHPKARCGACITRSSNPRGKLVRVVSGEVFDVAVDLRKSSAKFGQWVGEILSAENKHQLWVPPGFAHGFLVLNDTAEFEYKCTDYYAPEFERAIRWDDPDIDIEWPLPIGEKPVLSEKDVAAPFFKDAKTYA